MTRRHCLGWIAAILGSFVAISTTAAEPVAGEWDPTISKHHGQYALYGYFPTQWKTFPDSWSQMRPIVVTSPTTPELAPGAQQLPPKVESDPMQSKTGLILPLPGPAQHDAVESKMPTGPMLLAPTGNATTQAADVPTIPDLVAGKSAADVASNLDPHATESIDAVWSQAGNSGPGKESKAWLGLPVPVQNPNP